VPDPQDRVDIPGLETHHADSTPAMNASTRAPKPWLGILFNCCHVYGRIHKQPDGRYYKGRCPSCGTDVSARVGPSGTNQRFFETT
jgi:hypothetical protein